MAELRTVARRRPTSVLSHDFQNEGPRNGIAALITRLSIPPPRCAKRSRGAQLRTDHLLARAPTDSTALGVLSALRSLLAPGPFDSTGGWRWLATFATQRILAALRILRRADRAAGDPDLPFAADAPGVSDVAADARRVL